MVSGAPLSLAHQAARTHEQESALIHSHQVEDAIKHLLRHAERNVAVDKQWLTIARHHLQIGMMCVNRAIMRQDFF
jgi:hypothetical protein